jgi:hypothetical protein
MRRAIADGRFEAFRAGFHAALRPATGSVA